MTQRKLLVTALSIGLLTAFFVYTYVRAAVGGPKEAAKATIVVASESIRAKTTLTASMLTVKEMPASMVHSDAVRNLDEVVGRLTKENLLSGEPVLYQQLYGENERPGLTFVIPPGKRAVSVAVNEVIGVAGFIKPGDFVDIIGTFESAGGNRVTTTVLQAVEVLAISQKMEDDDVNAKVATTVTLALALEEAEKVTLAEEEGSLRLALRPVDQNGKEYVPSVTTSSVTSGKVQTLQKISPAIKTNSSSSSDTTSSAASGTSSSSPAPAPATSAANPASSAGIWAVEVYRGVDKEVVSVGDADSTKATKETGGQ